VCGSAQQQYSTGRDPQDRPAPRGRAWRTGESGVTQALRRCDWSPLASLRPVDRERCRIGVGFRVAACTKATAKKAPALQRTITVRRTVYHVSKFMITPLATLHVHSAGALSGARIEKVHAAHALRSIRVCPGEMKRALRDSRVV